MTITTGKHKDAQLGVEIATISTTGLIISAVEEPGGNLTSIEAFDVEKIWIDPIQRSGDQRGLSVQVFLMSGTRLSLDLYGDNLIDLLRSETTALINNALLADEAL
jgi:hypothetical protein